MSQPGVIAGPSPSDGRDPAFIDADAELGGASLTPTHIGFCAIIGFALFLDGYDLFNASYVAPLVRREWGLSAPAVGQLLSIGLAGLAFGAVLQGPFADRIGRRKVLLTGIWGLGGTSLWLALGVHSFAAFCLVRFILGISLGVLSPIAFTYIAEWAPTRLANRFATTAFVLPFSLGGIAAGVLGLSLGRHDGWRALYGVAALGIPLAVLCHFVLPESTRFLIARRRWAEVAHILCALRPGRREVYLLALQRAQFGTSNVHTVAGSFADLLSPDLRRITIVLWVGGALSSFCIHGLSGWLPSLMIRQGSAVSTAFTYGTLLMIMQICGGFACGWLADRIGRGRAMAMGFCGGALSMALLAATLTSPAGAVFVAASGFFIFGAQAILNNHIALSYPVHIRGLGVGTTVGINRLGGVLGPIAIGYEQGLAHPIFATFVGLVFAQVAAAIVLSERTGGTRSRRHDKQASGTKRAIPI